MTFPADGMFSSVVKMVRRFSVVMATLVTLRNCINRPRDRPEHDHPVGRHPIQGQGSRQRSRPVQRPQAPPPPPPPPRLGGQGALCRGARERVHAQALPRQRGGAGKGSALVAVAQ